VKQKLILAGDESYFIRDAKTPKLIQIEKIKTSKMLIIEDLHKKWCIPSGSQQSSKFQLYPVEFGRSDYLHRKLGLSMNQIS